MEYSNGRKEDPSSNIPHMHLFMYLKRRFPGLKDADITDSIQRFGLNRVRCEEELNRKAQEQHRGYYSPWNRSRSSSSRGSPSNRSSPLSPSETQSQVSSPLQNGSVCSTPYTEQSQFAMIPPSLSHAIREPGNQSLNAPSHTIPSPSNPGNIIYSNASNNQVSTTSAGSSEVKRLGPPLIDIGPSQLTSNGFSDFIHESISAPVFPEVRELAFDPSLVHRRSSAESVTGGGTQQLIEWGGARSHSSSRSVSPRPSASMQSPSSPTQPTTSPPSTTSSCPTTTRTSFCNPSTHALPHPPVPAAIQEQLTRKEKLHEELNLRIQDKVQLEGEVKRLLDELEAKEKSQRLEVVRSKEEIEKIQRENSRLQLFCDKMEREILESGESPETDQEGRSRHDLSPSLQDSPLRLPLQPPPLPRAGSTSSLSSGGIVTPTTPLLPTRKAPSPPISTNSISPPVPTFARPGVEHGVSRPATAVTDEGGKEWSCSKCTFLNSPYLKECEICNFPHFSLGTPPHFPPQASPGSSAPAQGGPCYCHHRHHYNLSHEHHNAGEMQDIHIQVRHQNLHSSPRRCDVHLGPL